MRTYVNKAANTSVLVALLLLSCTKEAQISECFTEISEQEVILEATIASSDPDTKTVRQSDNKVFWAPGDAISLFYGSGSEGGNKFTALCTEPVAVTNFTGNIGVITGGGEISMDETYFWGVYPYSDSTSCNGSSITTILPAQQKTAAGSFGNGQFPTLGRSLGLTMAFYNICGGIRFTVVHDDIRSVEFKSLSGSSIAGKLNVGLDQNGLPVLKGISDGSDTIVVTPEDGKTFVPGTTYFAVIPPTVMSGGLEVTYKTLTTKATKTFTSSITITRSVFSGLTAQDNGLTFELRDDNVPFEDALFKAYCVQNFDTDGDGEISITEAQDVINVDCNNKNISSLEGIEYFTALRILYCYSNQLTSLDVSGNIALNSLSCFSNQLTSLDVSSNAALKYLWCHSNQIASLDVSNNTALTNLNCSPMGTLDTLYIAHDQSIPHITENRSNDYIPELTEIVVAGQAIDLSASGPANCYIVSEKGTYKFKTVQGNSNTSVGEVKGVKVLWESFGTNVAPAVGDLINPEVTYADNYITFSTNNTYKKGNAVIAAYSDADCTDGNVLWSWHIWLSGIAADDMIAQTWNNIGDMLDRNLGAVSNDVSYGDVSCLMYQRNRKDPFLGGCFNNIVNNNVPEYTRMVANIEWPPVESGTFTYEQLIANPTSFVSGSLPTDGWAEDSKGIMDPCPPGYKMPGKYYYVSLLESNNMSESPYHDVAHYGSSIYKTSYNDLWFPYTKKLDLANNWVNEYSVNYADGLLWTANGCFLHRIYDGEMYPNYTSTSNVGAAAVRCIKESSSPVVLPQSIELSADTVIVSPGSSFTMSASISPTNANVQTINWDSKNSFVDIMLNKNQTSYCGNECQITTGSNIGKYLIKIESPLARKNATNDPLSKELLVMNCPSEPNNGDGGWYIYAKAGDTFSFHLDVGNHEDGSNEYNIYVGEERVKYDIGSSDYHIDFEYTFTDTFRGWISIGVGWGFYVSNITTTSVVRGRCNKYNGDLRMYDSWTNGTPKFKFSYQNHVLTME